MIATVMMIMVLAHADKKAHQSAPVEGCQPCAKARIRDVICQLA